MKRTASLQTSCRWRFFSESVETIFNFLEKSRGYLFFKFANHSLIYQKGIITVIEVWTSENVLRFFLVSIEKTFVLTLYLTQSFITFSNTSKLLKNTPLRVIFEIIVSGFGNVINQFLSYLTGYVSDVTGMLFNKNEKGCLRNCWLKQSCSLASSNILVHRAFVLFLQICLKISIFSDLVPRALFPSGVALPTPERESALGTRLNV